MYHGFYSASIQLRGANITCIQHYLRTSLYLSEHLGLFFKPSISLRIFCSFMHDRISSPWAMIKMDIPWHLIRRAAFGRADRRWYALEYSITRFLQSPLHPAHFLSPTP